MIAAILSLVALPALAELRTTAHATGDVIIGDQVVMTIRATAGGMSIQQRVDQVTARVNKLLGIAKLDSKLMTITKVGADYTVSYNGDLLATADSKTASLDGMTTMKLANQWAANLLRVIPLAQAKPSNPPHQ
jgi:copper chaperone CopZ